MARTLRDAQLDTRAARQRLKVRGKPYYRSLDQGLHIGYRKSRDSGRWVMRWYVGDHDYIVETLEGVADDKADPNGDTVLNFSQAQAKVRALHIERTRTARGLPAQSGPYTVKQCVDDYIAWLEEHRRSAQDARYRAEAQIEPVLGHVECSKLTTPQLQKWLRDLAATAPRIRVKKDAKQPRFRKIDTSDENARRRRRATANRVLTTLRAALNRAWREGLIPSDAAWRRVQPFAQADAARVRYLTLAEATRLVNACEPDFRRLVQAALATGCRYGELAALTVSDFNPDSGTVHVRTSKSGKGRHVVLGDEGVTLFRGFGAGKAGDALLLTKADGSAWGDCHQLKRIAAANKRAKIAPPINFHGLRHTWASLAVMNGTPLMVVSRNLGHSDTRMCEKHYSHLAKDFVSAAIRQGAPHFGFKADPTVVSARVPAA